MHKGSNLPDEDHILRHISKSKLFLDENGLPIAATPQAFVLRSGEESLSVHWVEHAGDDVTAAVQRFRNGRDVRPNSFFAKANIGNLKKVCAPISKAIKVVWAPSLANTGHSSIQHIPDDPIFSTVLADDVFVELIRNSDIP